MHQLRQVHPKTDIVNIETSTEIQRERYALKLLRGDFESLSSLPANDMTARVRGVLQAIDA